jgi:DNA-binding NtrC family response regulator
LTASPHADAGVESPRSRVLTTGGLLSRSSHSLAARHLQANTDAVASRSVLRGAESAAFRAALKSVERFSRDRSATVLLEGEAGTGKTTVARYLHHCSARAAEPFQAVVLSTLDDSLASAELFGHVAGAFTGAHAHRAGHFVSAAGGTLFLDEIGKASKGVQQKLLHAIEYGEITPVGADRPVRVDVRVVAASNMSLAALVSRGEFLADLHDRISAFRIELPPLRERRMDIPALVHCYVERHAIGAGYRDSMPSLDADLMTALLSALWPGNLRQLDATIHRLLVEGEGASLITLGHCTGDLAYLRESQRKPLTRERVDEAISSAGSITGAAQILRVDRTTVHRFQRKRAQVPQVSPHE